MGGSFLFLKEEAAAPSLHFSYCPPCLLRACALAAFRSPICFSPRPFSLRSLLQPLPLLSPKAQLASPSLAAHLPGLQGHFAPGLLGGSLFPHLPSPAVHPPCHPWAAYKITSRAMELGRTRQSLGIWSDPQMLPFSFPGPAPPCPLQAQPGAPLAKFTAWEKWLHSG